MNRSLAAFLAGVVFGIGLIVAQMTNPAKVIGFLDITGNWDPSLAFVMGGAVVVFGLAYRLSLRRSGPLLAAGFVAPRQREITAPLVLGSLVFGVGWGLSGFCPGPAVVSSTFGDPRVWVFVAAMLAGMLVYRLRRRRTPTGAASDSGAM